jgi:ubiquinone/menaquinone biosynthesis C-methylase UbiE
MSDPDRSTRPPTTPPAAVWRRTRRPKDGAAVRRQARDQFEKWALSYDRSWLNEFVFFPSIRRCQAEIARWQRSRGERPYRMLDVGCGTGTLLCLAANEPLCQRLVGLDYAGEMARRAAEKFAASPHAGKLQAVRGDAERLPFADRSFDVVTCCNSFHHYPHQPATAAEFRRVLRPGGMLILIDGFRDNVIGWFLFDVAVSLVERNVHHPSWSEMRCILETAGFTRIEQHKASVLAPLLVNVAST